MKLVKTRTPYLLIDIISEQVHGLRAVLVELDEPTLSFLKRAEAMRNKIMNDDKSLMRIEFNTCIGTFLSFEDEDLPEWLDELVKEGSSFLEATPEEIRQLTEDNGTEDIDATFSVWGNRFVISMTGDREFNEIIEYESRSVQFSFIWKSN